MIDRYETYKLLYLCLSYYGPNRRLLKELSPLKLPSKPTVNVAPKVVRRKENDNRHRNSDQGTDDEYVPYVIHEHSDREISDIFDDYYD